MAVYAFKVYKRGRLKIISIIKIVDLKKTYMSYARGSGFAETLKSVFVRRPVELHALKGISFTVEEGELLGFLGPNGALQAISLFCNYENLCYVCQLACRDENAEDFRGILHALLKHGHQLPVFIDEHF